MMEKLWTKVGVALIGGLLLGSGVLGGRVVQAHKPDSPTCSGLPTDEDFFDTTETAAIASDALTHADPAFVTKQGTGSAAKGGNTGYRYAKITVPQLAAGELRVFDTRTSGDNASDAVLCHRTSTRARYRTTHPSSHTSAESNRTTALSAQTKAADAGSPEAINTINLTDAKTALSSAATSLRTAAANLRTAATNLNKAADAATKADNATLAQTLRDAATTATGVADATYTPIDTSTDPDTAASGHAVTADTNAKDTTRTLTNIKSDLRVAAGHLGTAAQALRAAANELHDIEKTPTVFQLRAEVRPGDQEYILVTTGSNAHAVTGGTASADAPTLAVQFHGAIAAPEVQRERVLNTGAAHTIPITVTAPGLLTLETTGSTDTLGMLYNSDRTDDLAHAESGGSGDNFKMDVPVTAPTSTIYNVVVEGQTSRTSGAYTLEMDFKVAMSTGGVTANIPPVVGNPTWTGTALDADDTMVQIRRIAEDGSTADADYFLFTPTASGYLTVNANNDTTSAKDSNTSGTLYGAKEMGPMSEPRVGQIATDADSGPSNHFKFTVPVEGNRNYLVKVEGTDGVYTLELDFDEVAHSATIMPPNNLSPASLDCSGSDNDANEICSSTGTEQERDRYLFNIAESGTLYVHSTGTTDVYGTLYGPDGTIIAEDDDDGDGMNFRIAAKVAAGLYILEVKGQTRQTQGVYGLISNFVTGDGPEPPREPTTPTDPDPDPEPEPTTDATGSLDNPPNNRTRSGVGIINGWVCQAEEVTITITPVGSTTGTRFNIGYGGYRPDTVGQCDHTSANTGFAMAYTFNNLDEGEYEIEARADGKLINTTPRRFTVLHLVPGNAFPRNLVGGARVLDFPTTGDITILEWETSSQGFVITDVQ